MPRAGWSLLPLTNRSAFTKSLRAQIFCGLLIAFATIGLTSCYDANSLATKFPTSTFANRPIPPSQLMDRVLVAITVNGTTGTAQILDGLRDIRSNLTNTRMTFSISGSVGGSPKTILNFPAEIRGYTYSSFEGALNTIDYGTEAVTGTASSIPGASSIAIPPTFGHIYAAQETPGLLQILDNTGTPSVPLNIPNVYYVNVNAGDTVVLAMVRNSNAVYRLIKLNTNQFPTSVAAIAATGAIDCQPLVLPIYCAIPVNTGATTNAFDRPTSVYFSLDGTTAYVNNCGAECGGTTSSVTYLSESALNVNSFTTGSAPNANAFVANVPTPGGATASIADGTTLYVSGQQLQPDGLFAGNLTTISLSNNTVSGTYSISDGHHTKMLFADDNTLWIGSQLCSTGERAHQAAAGVTTQAANYNCLTRFDRTALAASIVPAVNQTAGPAVSYPNTNLNQFYYGDLTGLCWVQGFHKVYTAYGGQVHAFNTADGSEINNVNITVQGTALDVAFMDAQTDNDN
jgi:hypothetical protein